jgi:hypothetical protein
MPERILKCSGCNTELGVMELGKIRKGTVFLCENCDNKRVGALMKMEANKYNPSKPGGYGDIFGDLFGKKY